MDLTKPEDQSAVMSWIRHPAVKGVFLAPPCGTASAARQIELPGESAPRPLRTLDEPDGLASLSGTDCLRVGLANVLYAFTAEVMDLCTLLGIACMVENPRNSLFWYTTAWSECESSCEHSIEDHQACAYGSSRAKWTRLTANFPQVHTICLTCSHDHEHAPWGIVQRGSKRVFATTLEVHYPKQLCDAIAHAFLLRFLEKGLKFSLRSSPQHIAKALTMTQTPTMKLPPLVQPYKSRLVVFYHGECIVWPLVPLDLKPCKTLHEVKFGVVVDVQNFEFWAEHAKRVEEELKAWHVDFSCVEFSKVDVKFDRMVVCGLQWEPQEFLDRALEVSHPMDAAKALPSELADTVRHTLDVGQLAIAKERLLFFKHWNRRAKELEPEEDHLKQSMDPLVADAVRSKRILLFEEMLRHYSYPDLGVVDELKSGVDLVGDVPATSMLPFKFTPSIVSVESLGTQSAMRRESILAEASGSGDTQIDLEVWEKTLEECKLGWLKGPVPLSDVPADAPISRRFGLKQKHKVRMIDDFTESSVNQAVTVFESPTLHTVDVASAL